MLIQRPDLLPAYFIAAQLQELHRLHPEAIEAYCSFGGNLTAQAHRIIARLKRGTFGQSDVATMEAAYATLTRLTAPAGNWN